MNRRSHEPDDGSRVVYRGSGFYVGLVLILVIAALILVFAIQNTTEVALEFLGLDFTVPVFAIALGAALVAVVLDELIGLVWRRQRRARLMERTELQKLRAQVRSRASAQAAPTSGPISSTQPTSPNPEAAVADTEESGPAGGSAPDDSREPTGG